MNLLKECAVMSQRGHDETRGQKRSLPKAAAVNVCVNVCVH